MWGGGSTCRSSTWSSTPSTISITFKVNYNRESRQKSWALEPLLSDNVSPVPRNAFIGTSKHSHETWRRLSRPGNSWLISYRVGWRQYMSQFDVVFNALDNIEARRHVTAPLSLSHSLSLSLSLSLPLRFSFSLSLALSLSHTLSFTRSLTLQRPGQHRGAPPRKLPPIRFSCHTGTDSVYEAIFNHV